MLSDINVKYWELIHGNNKGYHKLDDYSARCDICGDSSKNKHTKRLHLYRKKSYDDDSIKCFNCPYTGNMYSYIRTYHPEFFDAYKAELGMGSLLNLRESFITAKRVVPKNTIYTFTLPKELIKNDSRALEYLKTRKVSLPEVYYSEGLVQLEDKTINLKDYIIIPLKEGNECYGFYSRSTKEKTFNTYIPEQNTGYKIWNYFNISKKTRVYIFEAIFNALSTNYSNSIACMGSDIPDERYVELTDKVFLFDNDTTGREKSLKYANKGDNVFIWPKEIKQKDFNDLLKDGWTKDEITKLIEDNVYSGLTAVIKLKI